MNNLTLSELCFIVLEASWQPPNCANKTVLYFSRILSYAGHSKRKCTSSSTTVQEHFEHTRCCLGSLGRAHLLTSNLITTITSWPLKGGARTEPTYFDLSLFGDEWQGRIFDTFSSGPRGDIAETFTSDGPGLGSSSWPRFQFFCPWSLGWLRTGAPFEGPCCNRNRNHDRVKPIRSRPPAILRRNWGLKPYGPHNPPAYSSFKEHAKQMQY